MSTFLFILACIIWGVVLLGVGAGGIALTVGCAFDEDYKAAAASAVGTILAVAFIVWVGIATGLVADDNSKHCGPGTTYRESSRYDPATKTVRTDWVCEANR